MRLKTLAEIATIAALAIAALQYFKFEPNTLDKVSEDIKEIVSDDVGKIHLNFDPKEYEESQSIAFPMYQAGLLNPYVSGKSENLKDAAMAAIDEGDIRLAIVAADEIPYNSTKSETLEHVALEALKGRDTMKFAVLAADLIPYSSTKNSVIEKISGVYKHVKSGGSLEEYVNETGQPKTPLDEYKEIYKFADSRSFMALDEESAKEFADNWFKDKSYQDFIVYREVFKFADSRYYMNMTEEEATSFALGWIDKYDLNDFLIFKDAYIFSSSGSFMALNEKDARKFALSKLEEQKKLTSQSSTPAENRGPDAQKARAAY